MRYVYLLQSQSSKNRRYIGVTNDLESRLVEHNAGKLPQTAQYRPWALAGYTAFPVPAQANTFERYLKSGSGHAFANRHLWPKEHSSQALA